MESIGETQWDLVINGKKILHVDRNNFYGGSEAALSLQDAEEWVAAGPTANRLRCRQPRITKAEARSNGPQLGFSRQYSLAMAPQIIHSRSVLLPTLISSKTYRQLEFLAVGSWFVCDKTDSGNEDEHGWRLTKVPASREDVFADKTLDLKAKRALIKLLRVLTEPDALVKAVDDLGDTTLETYLSEHYSMPVRLQAALCGLTLSPLDASKTPASWALPRLSKHLASIGVFGPFAAVLPKWGGLSEVAQVACRALAVGGGTYMLGHPIEFSDPVAQGGDRCTVRLNDNETVDTTWLADVAELPREQVEGASSLLTGVATFARSVTIVGSPLRSLFPPLGDGAPPPAAAIVVLPPSTIGSESPVNLIVHSSETGECPAGQCIIYASTLGGSEALEHLTLAVGCVLQATGEGCDSAVLWTLDCLQDTPSVFNGDVEPSASPHRVHLEPMSMDLAFDERVLRDVRRAWMTVSGEESGFMEFEDREVGAYDDD